MPNVRTWLEGGINPGNWSWGGVVFLCTGDETYLIHQLRKIFNGVFSSENWGFGMEVAARNAI